MAAKRKNKNELQEINSRGHVSAGRGYISLFYEDSAYGITDRDVLQQAKDSIYEQYKETFRDVGYGRTDVSQYNPQDREDFQDFVNNTILQEISSDLTEQHMNQLPDPIMYYKMSVGSVYGKMKEYEDNTLEKVKIARDLIERSCNSISTAIERGGGLIDKRTKTQLEKSRADLEDYRRRLGHVKKEKTFRSIFWGSVSGLLSQAMGTVHEIAGTIAAEDAKKVAQEEAKKVDKEIEVMVFHTGGKVEKNSELMKLLNENNIDAGRRDSSKNDLTIAVKDGNGKIQWTMGLSLKATNAKEPKEVKIASHSLKALLEKSGYTEESYFNMAASLGAQDWKGASRSIAAIAKEKNISYPSSDINKSWKNVIYAALYRQVVEMFHGDGTALNSAQYLIINARVIPMYEVFKRLEDKLQNTRTNIYSIPGLKISGFQGNNGGIHVRQELVQANIKAFKEGTDRDTLRRERSSELWEGTGDDKSGIISSKLSATKISISLKYSELFHQSTR